MLANAKQDGTTQCDAIFIYCQRVSTVSTVYSPFSFSFILTPPSVLAFRTDDEKKASLDCYALMTDLG